MNNVTTFDNYPPFATNGSRNMNTESAKYAVGFLEGETFPAEWANYLFHGATKGVSDLNTAVQSIWKENINVIQGSGQTPSSSDNTQLKTAIELMIQNAVLTANAQVLAQAKLDAHPVGSLYWSSDPTDPSTLFGGTWVRIKDRFVLAAGDTYTTVPEGNATSGDGVGGSATVQLTESNLPAHNHKLNGNNTSSEGTTTTAGIRHSGNTGSMNSNSSGMVDMRGVEYEGSHSSGNITITQGDAGYGGGHSTQANIRLYINVSHTHSLPASYIYGNTDTTGSDTPFNVMNPYIVKFCWERTA